MTGKKLLLVIGSVTFLVGLIALIPAHVAYRALAPDAIKLSSISGSIWRGSAREGQIENLYLRNLEWQFRPLGLLSGRLTLDTQFEPAGGFVESRVAVSAGGQLTLSDLEGGVSIAALQAAMPTPGIEGNVRLSFSRLTIEDGFPTEADGTIEVVGLVARGLTPATIGNFKADLQTTDEGIAGSVEDTGAMLDVAGAVKLNANRSYSFTGLVAPTESTPEGITNQLRFLGSANERGQREFRFEGQL